MLSLLPLMLGSQSKPTRKRRRTTGKEVKHGLRFGPDGMPVCWAPECADDSFTSLAEIANHIVRIHGVPLAGGEGTGKARVAHDVQDDLSNLVGPRKRSVKKPKTN